MHLVIAGGSGLIGSALANSFLADGYQVSILTRHPDKVRLPQGASAVGWDGHTVASWGELMNHADAVLNLAGKRLSSWPWTRQKFLQFWTSRVDAGRALVAAIGAASSRPPVFVQASGINYYGPHGLETVTEADAAGTDSLAELSLAWEASTEPVEALGVRRVITRSAVVLARDDGILPLYALPASLFVGGRFGNGRQGLSWIHLEDEVAAMRFLIENQEASGAFNLTSPHPVSSAEFLRMVASVLHRPFWLPLPAFILQLVLGKMSTLLLEGAYPLPKRLLDLGFHFRFEDAEAALRDLLAA